MNAALRRLHPRRLRAPLLTVVTHLSLASPALAQCAMCQGGAGATNQGGAAYNTSTLFMLAIPYLLLLGVAGYVVHAFRRPRPDSAGEDSGSTPGDTTHRP